MFHVIVAHSSSTPVQKLRARQDAPESEFSVIVSEEEIEELSEYINEVTYDPAATHNQIKKLLLLYVAAVRFVILEFSNASSIIALNTELSEQYENLAKSLYTFYKDLDIILLVREISSSCRAYAKLVSFSTRVPDSSHRKIVSGRDRILFNLKKTSDRIKTI